MGLFFILDQNQCIVALANGDQSNFALCKPYNSTIWSLHNRKSNIAHISSDLKEQEAMFSSCIS